MDQSLLPFVMGDNTRCRKTAANEVWIANDQSMVNASKNVIALSN